MSKWRLKGFVQDSDDEEEDLEITPSHSNREGQHERVKEPLGTDTETGKDGQGKDEYGLSEGDVKDGEATGLSSADTPRRAASNRPTVSPITPFGGNAPSPQPSTPPTSSLPGYGRNITESPDPLHAPLGPAVRQREEFPSSSLSLGAPVFHQLATGLLGQDHKKKSTANGFLEELGIVPFSDASDSDILSDPPSDMDEPIIQTTMFASPKRRTAVQVVIPRSSAAQQEFMEQQAARSLRQRKPIQLHPYALEGEMYRRNLQDRGINPVARQRSPKRTCTHDDAETQEQEFNPNREVLSSSPRELPASTPNIQRPAKESHGSSVRPESSLKAQRDVALSLHVRNGFKRRKFDRSLFQPATPVQMAAENLHTPNDDMWSIPQSPPHSRSPPVNNANSVSRRLIRPYPTNPARDLPTPSQSSSLQGDIQPPHDSDFEPVVRSVRRSTERRRQIIVIPSDNSSTSSQLSGNESNISESQLKLWRKKTKGVLPASHFRFEQEAQAKRDARTRHRLDTTLSPHRTEPQRGVARRVTQRREKPRPSAASTHPHGVITIPDDSDDELSSSGGPAMHVQQSAQAAADLAATFDQRYADGDSDTMENDRLELFTLGGPSRKRKKQTKLHDIFAKTKKSGSSGGGTRTGSTSHSLVPGVKKHATSRRARCTSPPALSVLDFDQSPSGGHQHIPQFLRIAKRQARQRPDYAREAPTNKHIRLQTAIDTEDAHTALRQWRSGVLKPKTTLGHLGKRSKERGPLIDVVPNARRSEHQSDADKPPDGVLLEGSRRKVQTPRMPRQQKLPPELLIIRRSPVPSKVPGTHESAATSGKSKQRQPIQRKHRPFRAAQLEGLETEYGRSDRRMTFQQGLREVDRLFDLQPSVTQPSRNPQLARYLANADTVFAPVPTAHDATDEEHPPLANQLPVPRRHLKRKAQAHRLDVDTRNYRQPSEPALADLIDQALIVDNTVLVQEELQGQPALQGLGPYGTRYSTTFDVSPLKPGTYFHESTFIGGMSLHRALASGGAAARDLDQAAGYFTISHNEKDARCGPWNDETLSLITDLVTSIWRPLDDQTLRDDDRAKTLGGIFQDSSKLLRSISTYFSTRLSFLDSIDRQSFTTKLKHFGESLLNEALKANILSSGQGDTPSIHLESLRMMTYLLVVIMQTYKVAQHPVVGSNIAPELAKLMVSISKPIVSHIVRQVSQLSEFLDTNKRFLEREKGIQNSEILVESVVVCMHVLAAVNVSGATFWDLVNQELALNVRKATSLYTFESLWGTLFTLLPFVEVDDCGIIDHRRRTSIRKDDWTMVRDMLKRLFALYPYTYRIHSSSLNNYVRANLTRCHHLIQFWHWNRCDRMLNEAYDFFAKNGLKNLPMEESNGSVQFLEDHAAKHALHAAPNDKAFHTFLKCLALGLLGMRNVCPEKEIRSFASRLIPLHGRSNPKDQPMEIEDRDALKNQHDLLCTLYYATPPSCRPKLDLLRDLVDHETSHREACRLNVRAWASLSAFQLSTDELYIYAQPLSQWHKEIIKQTLKQYHLAKTEAEIFLKSGERNEMGASSLMVRQAMEKNQEQVIATLRDCVAGMQRAITTAIDPASLKEFLIDSGLVDLLRLPHLEDARLVAVIRDILGVLRLYAPMLTQKPSLATSQLSAEESQDLYGGESIDVDLFYALERQQPDVEQTDTPLDFIQTPLWNLLSNAFGAERAPDDNLLMDCVDTWALVASNQVILGARSWSYYINPHGSVSWQQLSQTDQTQKFAPYFMAAIITRDSSAYTEHRLDFFNALLLSLADRESMLRFQHRLLLGLSHVAFEDPLMSNLPFFKDTLTGEFDITAKTLRTRRLALISSMLANMRKDFHNTIHENTGSVTEVKENYSVMLRGFMTAMKSNYQQLGQETRVTGAYVEFVQKVVQFLQQHTADICPVPNFFTNSAAFPLPATDPTYVVGRLCGYAPKISKSGISKQLSVFVQTVAQQAAAGNQQSYLLSQIKTVLCTDHSPSRDRTALRDVLLQGVFSSYIEAAFGSVIGFVIAKPILQSLKPVLQAALFDIRVFDQSNVCAVHDTIMTISHAFIRNTEQLRTDAHLIRQPYILHAIALMLDTMVPILPLLEYVYGRCSTWTMKPAIIGYIEHFTVFIVEVLHDLVPRDIPVYDGDTQAAHYPHSDLSSFCAAGLVTSIKTNWSTNGGRMFFGQGHAKREIPVDLGSMEEEKARLANAIQAFDAAVITAYGAQYLDGANELHERSFIGDVNV